MLLHFVVSCRCIAVDNFRYNKVEKHTHIPTTNPTVAQNSQKIGYSARSPATWPAILATTPTTSTTSPTICSAALALQLRVISISVLLPLFHRGVGCGGSAKTVFRTDTSEAGCLDYSLTFPIFPIPQFLLFHRVPRGRRGAAFAKQRNPPRNQGLPGFAGTVLAGRHDRQGNVEYRAGFMARICRESPAGWRDDVLAPPWSRRGVTTWSCTPLTPGSSLACERA